VNYYCIAATVGNAPPNAAFWYPLTGAIYEIPTPYATADLARLQFFQSKRCRHDPASELRPARTHAHGSYDVEAADRVVHAIDRRADRSGQHGRGWRCRRRMGHHGAQERHVRGVARQRSYDVERHATAGAPITVTWTNSTGAIEYNIYKKKNGIYGYVGTSSDGAVGFIDNGINQDMTLTPPISRDPFTGASKRPSTGTYYQQRLVESNSINEPEKIYASRTAMFKNFTISSPLQDDDAVTFTIAGNKIARGPSSVDLGVLVVLTQSGEYIVEGDANGVFSATQPPNPRRVGANGASYVMPVIVNDSILYMQARGSVMRDLRYKPSRRKARRAATRAAISRCSRRIYSRTRRSRARTTRRYPTRSSGL
jgi:hypothetical protein